MSDEQFTGFGDVNVAAFHGSLGHRFPYRNVVLSAKFDHGGVFVLPAFRLHPADHDAPGRHERQIARVSLRYLGLKLRQPPDGNTFPFESRNKIAVLSFCRLYVEFDAPRDCRFDDRV